MGFLVLSVCELQTSVTCTFRSLRWTLIRYRAAQTHLNALLELVAGRGRAFPEQLTEDDDLLEEEDSAFFGARQDAGVLLRHKEGFLLQQFALIGQFSLQRR